MADKPWYETQFYVNGSPPPKSYVWSVGGGGGGGSVLGKREDSIVVDDVESPVDSSIAENAEQLRKWLESSYIYGDSIVKEYNERMDAHTAILNEVRKPSGILNFISKSSKTPAYEENEMEIGGNVCHLCGAKLLQHNCDITYKKRQHVRNVKRYECGTVVEKGYKSEGEGYLTKGNYSKVILGDDCVEI